MHINMINLDAKNCAQDFHNNSLENPFFLSYVATSLKIPYYVIYRDL